MSIRMARSSESRCTRLLIDLSHTARSDLNTGIQRVVRNLAKYLPEVCAEHGIECLPVIWRDGHFYPLQVFQSGGLRKNYSDLVRSLEGRYFQAYRQFANRLCSVPLLGPFRKLLVPRPGHAGVFSMPLRLYAQCNRLWDSMFPPRSRIVFQDEDVLLMPDGYWVLNKIWKSIPQVKANGTRVHTVVYDLLALTHPECFVEGAKEKFDRYVANIASHSDQIFTISRTVATQLNENLLQRGIKQESIPSISPFLMGADLSRCEGTSVRSFLADIFSSASGPTYLSVSTIEPRKNYLFALEAFEALWQSGQECQWIIAGRPGWKCEEQLEKLRHHSEFGKRLHVLHDLTDDELGYAYANARGVVCPSIAEGFGLPIVEGLWYGSDVFASDTEIHREVGGNLCRYFSLQSPDDLVRMVKEHLEQEHCERVHSPKLELPTWRDSARDLLAKMGIGNCSVANH